MSVSGTFATDSKSGDVIETLFVNDTGLLREVTLADEDNTGISFSEAEGDASQGPLVTLFYNSGPAYGAAAQRRQRGRAVVRRCVLARGGLRGRRNEVLRTSRDGTLIRPMRDH